MTTPRARPGCSFAHEAGAYVVGALSTTERLDFERHLADCDACSRAVRELAGLPGLLGRLDPSVVETPADDGPVPATVLPALVREVRTRRRRVVLVSAAGAAVVALVASLAVWWAVEPGEAPPAPPGSGSPSVVARAMDPVGEVPVQATLTLEPVAWGTRLGLICTYEPVSGEYELPESVDYVLVVRSGDGAAERVGSWRSEAGRTMRLSAGTFEVLEDITSVEVRTLDGRVVLRLRA
jgi:hypothetical protein